MVSGILIGTAIGAVLVIAVFAVIGQYLIEHEVF